ncbi:tyrosine--tRNA ligase [Anaeropeptidivorans aminofermentans]|uniref:tyrosine--tRNA ligase n=1 Tax=Anaeropeptidivorans aminofermentans TaxID=2934315 RepID=UPI002023C2D9|nr:tyrosine--tRNA ligase [Anaeropeptidivorans aminofermentans]
MDNKNAFDILQERGFIAQATHEAEIKELLSKERVTFYIGFDPTADSLHVGHFLTVMAMSHMQKAGHRPIILVGGGTGMVGDPTDRTDMRKMMTAEEVQHNVDCFKKQLSKFIDFEDDKAIMANNADWLLNLKYVDFIRDYGVHFSVNRMLTADSYRTRFEKGLSFFEFNYMLMQSYDFLELYRRYGCKMQLGGNDQWSNIIGGVELIRKVENQDAYGLTFTLLTTSDNKKMGKTQRGAVWLDPEKTTPYEFFQYWRNVEDASVEKCLGLLTFLPMEEVRRLGSLQDKDINIAKEALAYEITKNVHGEEEAKKALEAARALFAGGAHGGSIPATEIEKSDIEKGISIIELLEKASLIPSRGEGRRLITQGGIKVNDEKVEAFDKVITADDFKDGELMIQKGKKVFHKVTLNG